MGGARNAAQLDPGFDADPTRCERCDGLLPYKGRDSRSSTEVTKRGIIPRWELSEEIQNGACFDLFEGGMKKR